MFDLLLKDIAWVTLSFDDKSVRVIKTTLSEKILSEFGVKAKPGYFLYSQKNKPPAMQVVPSEL